MRRSVERWVPGLSVARNYERAWLTDDVMAGIVLAALLIPQGLAYAQLAGLPPVTGLYTTVTALLAYAVFGPSRILVLGPDSALAPLIAAAVVAPAAGNPAEAVALAGVLAVLVGVVCVGAGLLRLGAVTELLSKPVRVGYLNGLALVIVVGQLPRLFGFSIEADGFFEELGAFLRDVPSETNIPTLVIGGCALAAMVLMRWRAPRLPAVLIAMVGATVVTWAFDLEAEGVAVVGSLPKGFPTPGLSSVSGEELAELALAAVGISIVALADTSALSTGLGRERGVVLDPNAEAIGLGAANAAAGLFQGFPVSASTTRTVVAKSLGSKSQLTGVVGAVSVAVVVVFAGGMVRYLPQSTLAAVVLLAAYSLLDPATVRWFWRARRSEFWLSILTTTAVAVLGVFEGIAVAVVLSVATFVWRFWRPYDAVLGRLDRMKGYHDIERHPSADRIPGLVIFRFDAPIFFANADHFRRRVDQVLDQAPPPVRWLLIAAEPITDIDTSGADVLGVLIEDLRARDVQIAFAELKGPVKDRLRRYGLYDEFGDDYVFPTLGTAIDGYVDATGVDWVDWTDRRGRKGDTAG